MKIDIVIMCGGTGKRLRPLTYIMPKPFLKTNNISSFDYILKNIIVSNISKIFVSLFYKENIAKKIINKKKIPRLKIFVEKFAMGTAGCLAEIIKKNISNDFLVVNGDIFANLDFNQIIDFHKRKKNEITVGIKKYDINIPYAVMKKKEKKIIFVEKPKFKFKINTGIYILNKNFVKKYFKQNSKNSTNMTDLISYSKKVGVFDIGNKWIDIGHINDFKKAQNEIKNW